MRKWKLLFMNGCMCRSCIFAMREFFKLMPKWEKCISMLRDYFKK
jgi:hypothetical protein